jgi:glutathione peroxidase
VASECGFTPQYAELEQLYRRYADRGLVVLGFPSNDFGGQEPGTRAEILAFAQKEYGVTFPLFDKVHATGKEIAPLYRDLTGATDASLRGAVRWNFEKFVVAPDGRVVARMRSTSSPLSADVVAAIEKVLPAPAPSKAAEPEMSLVR